MRFAMELLVSRSYPFIDYDSLEGHQARDSWFRIADGSFMLHLSSTNRPVEDDRLVWIDCRTALLWINATPDEFGAEWE